jgi:hypothetical protein
MTERASIFAPREELDIGGFAPKSGQEKRPDPSEIDQVRSSRFRSRENARGFKKSCGSSTAIEYSNN